MTRLKSNCPGCGRLISNAKLISPPNCDEKLCIYCRKKFVKTQNKSFSPPINNSLNNSSQIYKSVPTSIKTRKTILSTDELRYLNKVKYKHDPFISGKSQCSSIINLKNKLMDCDEKIRNSKLKNQKEIETKEILNDKFLSGLK